MSVGTVTRRLGAVALVIGALALTSCAAEQKPAPLVGEAAVLDLARQAKEKHFDDQYELLKDGEISTKDRDDAFRRMSECMTEKGITVSSPTVNPADGLRYLFMIDGEGLDQDYFLAEQTSCLEAHWNFVDNGYMATRSPRMAPELMEAVQACLKQQGFTVPADAVAFRDLVGSPESDKGAQRDAAGTCVSEKAHVLYPDLDQISVSM